MAKNDVATLGKAAMTVITRLERDNRRMKKLLNDLHPHVMALAVSDDDPKPTRLLKRLEDLI